MGMKIGDIVEIISASPGWEDYISKSGEIIKFCNNEYYPVKLKLFNGEEFEAKYGELKLA